MGAKTGIEWTDATWNPIAGCRRVSPGCQHCYAERFAWRFAGGAMPFEGLVRETNTGPRWTGKLILRKGPSGLVWPLTTSPRFCFCASLSDVFQEGLPEEWILAVLGVMAVLPRWTFQVLTKRPDRAREILSRARRAEVIAAATRQLEGRDRDRLRRAAHACGPTRRGAWPLPNVWLGCSVEDQQRADKRLPDLVAAPAALRFVSAEPLLGAVSLAPWLAPSREVPARLGDRHGVRWVIAGGESGPEARPMHPAWARKLRDDCQLVGTAFFFKQWGAWAPVMVEADGSIQVDCPHYGRQRMMPHRDELVGRLLDGVLWSERP